MQIKIRFTLNRKMNTWTLNSVRQKQMKVIIFISLLLPLNILLSQTPGTEKWFLETGFEGVRSTPVIGEDGTIYFGSDNGSFYALNKDGTKKWEYQTGARVFSSPSLSTDGTIYVGSGDSKLYAINPDGTKKWDYNLDDMNAGIWSSPAIGNNEIIYFGSDNDTLYAIDKNGNKLWGFGTGDKVLSSPAIDIDGTIYIGSNDSKLYAINPDGSKKWEFETGKGIWFSSPAIGNDGTIYIGSDDSTLYAINNNGIKKWGFDVGGVCGNSPTIGSDGVIYIGAALTLYAINPDGTKKWEFGRGNGFYSTATIGYDGTIYIGSNSNKIFAINPDGSTKWEFLSGEPSECSPVISRDSLLYIGVSGFFGGLYAICCENNEYANSSWPKFRRDNRNSGNIKNITLVNSEVEDVITQYVLSQNYPNPFNPNTVISYSIPKQDQVELKVFDVLGREVTTLVNKEQGAGNYEVQFNGNSLTSGIYFYKLQSGNFTKTRKLILLR